MSFDVEFSEQNTAFNVSTQEGVNINLEGGSTDDYNSLKNKPKINSVELRGNLTLDELEIQPKGNYVTNNTFDTELEELTDVFNQGIATKQDKLVSGTNIKTINGESVLGNGNIDLEIVKVLEASSTNIIDFNALTEAGYYLIKNANANTTLNSPITDTGTYDMPLEVEKTALASGETEYEQLAEGGIVYRKYTNGEWYDWGNITEDMYEMSKAYTNSAIGGALSGSY